MSIISLSLAILSLISNSPVQYRGKEGYRVSEVLRNPPPCLLAVILKGCLKGPWACPECLSYHPSLVVAESSVIPLLAPFEPCWVHTWAMWFYSLRPFKQTKTYPSDCSHFILSLFIRSFLQCLWSNSVSCWLMFLHWAVPTDPGFSHFCAPYHQCLEASNQVSLTYVVVIHKMDAPCGHARCWVIPSRLLNLWSTDVLSYTAGNSELKKVNSQKDSVKKLLPLFLAIGGPWGKLISFQITGIQEDQSKQKTWVVARMWLNIVKMSSNSI